ncbi:hypothetical protein ACLBXM_07980 [Xanthobacteraceae bacterium A53D]
MPSDVFRADETALPADYRPLQPEPAFRSIDLLDEREAIWLEWEQHFLTEMALRSDEGHGFRN